MVSIRPYYNYTGIDSFGSFFIVLVFKQLLAPRPRLARGLPVTTDATYAIPLILSMNS